MNDTSKSLSAGPTDVILSYNALARPSAVRVCYMNSNETCTTLLQATSQTRSDLKEQKYNILLLYNVACSAKILLCQQLKDVNMLTIYHLLITKGRYFLFCTEL